MSWMKRECNFFFFCIICVRHKIKKKTNLQIYNIRQSSKHASSLENTRNIIFRLKCTYQTLVFTIIFHFLQLSYIHNFFFLVFHFASMSENTFALLNFTNFYHNKTYKESVTGRDSFPGTIEQINSITKTNKKKYTIITHFSVFDSNFALQI